MKWIIGTLALLATLLAVGVLWLAAADHEDLKPTFEAYVQELTGREFAINGQFKLEVGEYATLVAEDIQLGNEEWAIGPMVEVERLIVEVDYASLLFGTIIIRELTLQGTTLFLERLEDGRNNWTFGDPTAQTSENLFRVVLEQAHLHQTAITYRSPTLEHPMQVAIAYAQLEHRLIDDSLTAHITGTVNGRPIEVDAEWGTFENLLKGENVEYDLRGRFGGLVIDSHGFIDDLVDPSRPTISLNVASPNVDDVTAMLGLPDYGEGGLQLVGHLTPNDDNLELTVRGNLAGLEIDASGRASDLSALRLVEFDIAANGPHLGRFLNLIGIEDMPDEPFELQGHVRRSDSKLVIDNVVLDVGQARFRLNGIVEGFPGLDAANVHLNVAGPDLAPFSKMLGYPGSFTGPFELDVTIKQATGAADFVDAKLTTAPLQLQLHGPLGDPPNYDGSRFEVVGNGPNLHTVVAIFARSASPMLPEDPFSVQATVDVSSDGYAIENFQLNVRDASLTGDVNAMAQQGEFAIEVLLPDLQNLEIPTPGWQPDTVAFGLQAQGAWNGDRWTIDSSHVSLGEATLAWSGVFDALPDLSVTDLELSVNIPSLVSLGMFDGERLPEGALTFDAHFDGTEQALVMDELTGSLGRTRFTGGLRLAFDKPRTNVDANLEFTVIDPAIEQSADVASVTGPSRATALVRLRLQGSLGDPPNYVGSRFEFTGNGPNLHTVASIIAGSGASALPVIPQDPFSVQATIEVTADGFSLEDLHAQVSNASVNGSANVTTQQGAFTLEMSVPDLQSLHIPNSGWQPAAVAFGLQAQGSWNTDRWTIDSSHISLGEAALEWSGVFDAPPDFSATDLELRLDIPSLANLGTFDGERLPDRALTLDTHFAGTVQSFLMDELNGSLGGTRFTAGLSVDLSNPKPIFDADLDFEVLDLRDWEDDSEEVVDESAAATRVIPDYRLPITQLAAIDGTLDIVAHTVRLTNVTFTDALLKATLRDGALTISELSMAAPRGRLDGTLSVVPTEQEAEVHFTLSSQGLHLNLTDDPKDLVQGMVFDVDVDLTGYGATTREVAASLSGHASLESDGGRVRNRGVSLYTGFGRQLLSALNPFAKDTPYTEIACAIVSFEGTNGQFKTSPNIIVQTDKINLISQGAIDLRTERIDFKFNTKPRKRLSVSASELINPYIRVAGTLGKPKLTMNRRGTFVAATAAVATLGLSILAKAAWDRTFRRRDPCEK